MTMVLDDVRQGARHLAHESDDLRAGISDLRSIVDRMSAVLDRMEAASKDEPDTGGDDAG